MDNKIIIGISRKMGTGKSTVTKLLTKSLEEVNVQRYPIQHLCINYKILYIKISLTLEVRKIESFNSLRYVG